MVFIFVELRYCILFGLIKISFGQTLGQQTGSDVFFVIDFLKNPFSFKELEIYYSGLAKEPMLSRNVMSFFEKDDKCFSVVSKQYRQRISNAKINLSFSVTFILLNVSVWDTGKYNARTERTALGERILFVTDKALTVCTGKQAQFDFVLPLYPFTEALDVIFYSKVIQPLVVIQVADAVSGVCTDIIEHLQCRVEGYSLYIKIRTVQIIDQGIYALIGHGSGFVHESAILYVIGNGVPDCSPVAFTTHKTVSVTKVQEDTRDHTFTIKKEYLLGGGAVAGIVLVILTCLFIYKRCRRIHGNVASDAAYDNNDVHYCSTPCIQDQGVSDSVICTRYFPESQHRRVINVETNESYEISFDIATEMTSQTTKPFESNYITPY